MTDSAKALEGGNEPEPHEWSAKLSGRRTNEKTQQGSQHEMLRPLDPQFRAQLLYEYCITSEKKVSETIHSLYIIAEHYAAEDPDKIENPEVINGIPSFFETLTPEQKAEYCYDQVTAALSLEALPVTAESLRATKRTDPDDPWSSYAGRFVRRVTVFVILSLFVMAGLYVLVYEYIGLEIPKEKDAIAMASAVQWIAFGCIGALVHLLNNALTATRLQTFELSEQRKIGPRLLLGGMFGFIAPWLFLEAGQLIETPLSGGSVVAFFGGYSVRFSMALIDRVMAAIVPETKPTA